jgi:hypothetical protein
LNDNGQSSVDFDGRPKTSAKVGLSKGLTTMKKSTEWDSIKLDQTLNKKANDKIYSRFEVTKEFKKKGVFFILFSIVVN